MTETTVERTRIEREVAEAVRRENEGIVHRFFTLSRELLSIADIDGCLRRVNPAWEATLGWTPDDLTGKPFVDFVHPDDRAGTLAAIEQLATGQGLVAFENRYRCKDGSFRWLQWSSVAAPEQGLVYAAARDITERKDAEEVSEEVSRRSTDDLEQRVAARTAELSAANEELEAFAYSVSHDLRAPLRGIDGFSQAVLEEYSDQLDEKGQDYLLRLRSASQRMGILIDDILNLSRISRVEPGHEPVDLSAIATAVAADMREREPGRQVEFVIEDGVTGLGDSRFLGIVFENLFANAFKFTSTHETARIEFGRERRGRRGRLLRPGRRRRLRHGLRRPAVHPVPSSAQAGGLPGIGDRPRHHPPHRPPPRRTYLGSRRGRRRRNRLLHAWETSMNDTDPIVLVDDNEDDIVLTRRALERNKIENPLVVARDGAEALELLLGANGDTVKPAIILLDLKLPKVDGLSVLKRLRDDHRTRLTPIVVLTSSKQERDVIAGYTWHANSYIHKPVDFDQFTEAIRQIGLYWLHSERGSSGGSVTADALTPLRALLVEDSEDDALILGQHLERGGYELDVQRVDTRGHVRAGPRPGRLGRRPGRLRAPRLQRPRRIEGSPGAGARRPVHHRLGKHRRGDRGRGDEGGRGRLRDEVEPRTLGAGGRTRATRLAPAATPHRGGATSREARSPSERWSSSGRIASSRSSPTSRPTTCRHLCA